MQKTAQIEEVRQSCRNIPTQDGRTYRLDHHRVGHQVDS